MADRAPPGFLTVWTEVDPGAESEYLAWLTREHLPERVGIEGFVSGRVHRATDGTSRFFVIYETESAAVLGSAPYLNRLNAPTEWSARMHPRLRGTVRAVGQAAHAGIGSGSFVATLRATSDRVPFEIGHERIRRILAGPLVCGVRLLRCDAGTTNIDTIERRMRASPDGGFGHAYVIEAMAPDALDRALAAFTDALREAGAGEPSSGRYALIHALEKRWMREELP